MLWQLRGVLARWEMASDCLISLQKHTYFHDYFPVVCTWRVSVCLCECVYFYPHSEEKRDGRGKEEAGTLGKRR